MGDTHPEWRVAPFHKLRAWNRGTRKPFHGCSFSLCFLVTTVSCSPSAPHVPVTTVRGNLWIREVKGPLLASVVQSAPLVTVTKSDLMQSWDPGLRHLKDTLNRSLTKNSQCVLKGCSALKKRNKTNNLERRGAFHPRSPVTTS